MRTFTPIIIHKGKGLTYEPLSIDKAIEIAESFVLSFSAEENEGWINKDFEETLEQFVKNRL